MGSVNLNIKLRIHLDQLEPAIERVIEVHESTTFAQLHTIIQLAFQWENSHLHQFQILIDLKRDKLIEKEKKEIRVIRPKRS